ncbi:MAG: hypothetical protein WD512_10470 [Candidatus Paceibacterota bacterium]
MGDYDQITDAIQKEFILKKGPGEWDSSDDEYVAPKIDNDEYWENYVNKNLTNENDNEITKKSNNEMINNEIINQTNWDEKEMTNNEMINQTNRDEKQMECKLCGNNDLFSDKIGKFLNYCYICKMNVDI